jgi:Pterin 4 alpha carbinolamine dehydratase
MVLGRVPLYGEPEASPDRGPRTGNSATTLILSSGPSGSATFAKQGAFVQDHPDISFGWGDATVGLQTKKIGGLHENDFIIATKIDQIFDRSIIANRSAGRGPMRHDERRYRDRWRIEAAFARHENGSLSQGKTHVLYWKRSAHQRHRPRYVLQRDLCTSARFPEIMAPHARRPTARRACTGPLSPASYPQSGIPAHRLFVPTAPS